MFIGSCGSKEQVLLEIGQRTCLLQIGYHWKRRRGSAEEYRSHNAAAKHAADGRAPKGSAADGRETAEH